jgi:acyl-CoA hydrolase
MTNLSPQELISRYKGQIETAECAVLAVKAGDRVFVGTACATPRTLIAALETTSRPPPDVELIHFITTAAIPHDQDGRATTKYRHRTFFVGSDVRSAVKLGMADYVPIQISRVPELIERGSISIDVAMIQISPPDEFGYASFGVSVDIIPAAVAAAKWVIAEVNPAMPRTQGDTAIHMRDIDIIVPVTILKLRAELIELRSAIRQLRHAGLDSAAAQLLLTRKRAELERANVCRTKIRTA